MAFGSIREWKLNCKVYIGEIGRQGCSKRELDEMFSKYGRIKQTWVAKNPPGFAFVEYYNPRDAERAVRHMDGKKLHGRGLRVQMSTGRSKRSRSEIQERNQSLSCSTSSKRSRRTPSFSDHEDSKCQDRMKQRKEKNQSIHKSKKQYSGIKTSDQRDSPSDYRRSRVTPSTSRKSMNRDRDDSSSCSSTISSSSRSSVESTNSTQNESGHNYKCTKVISKRKWKSLTKNSLNIKVEPSENSNVQQPSSEMEISSTKNNY